MVSSTTPFPLWIFSISTCGVHELIKFVLLGCQGPKSTTWNVQGAITTPRAIEHDIPDIVCKFRSNRPKTHGDIGG